MDPSPRVRIVTDSVSDLPDDLLARYDITMVPAYVQMGSESYRDRVEMTPKELLDQMVASPYPAKSSQPPPGDFLTAYENLTGDGSPVVSIHVSSLLSGTYQSAVIARSMLPDRDIEVVDTQLASMGQGWAVLEAAKAALAGLSKEEILGRMREVLGKVRIFLSLDTLEFLRKNGRLGGAQALLGSLLQIKPILTVENGIIQAYGKVRGASNVIPRLVEICREKVGESRTVMMAVVHADWLDRARQLKAELEKVLNLKEAVIAHTGAAIMANTGPGGLGVMFYPAD